MWNVIERYLKLSKRVAVVVSLIVLVVAFFSHTNVVHASTPGTTPEFSSKFGERDCGEWDSETNQWIVEPAHGKFCSIDDVALSPDGAKLYVVDANNNRIQVFNTSDNSFADEFGGKDCGSDGVDPAHGKFCAPSGIALSHDGSKLYVADAGNDRIQILNTSDNSFADEFGETSCGEWDYDHWTIEPTNGRFCFKGYYSNAKLTVSPDGAKLYVVDANNNRIQVFNTSDNSFADEFGDGELSLYAGSGLNVSPDGSKLYVTDTGNNRIQVFNTSDNSFADEFGETACSKTYNWDTFQWIYQDVPGGTFCLPYDVEFSYNGKKFYVADGSNNRIQVFNTSDNSFADEFGEEDCGQFDYVNNQWAVEPADGKFCTATGIVVSQDGSKLYTADSINNRIQVFSIPPVQELTNAETEAAVQLQLPAGTEITCSATHKELALTAQDATHQYPLGLVEFCFTTDNEVDEASLTFVTNLTPDQVTARKYNSTTNTYFDIDNAVITQTTYNGQPALQLTYTIADNGPLDLDPEQGQVKDPVGLAVTASDTNAGSTTAVNQLAGTGKRRATYIIIALFAVVISTCIWAHLVLTKFKVTKKMPIGR